MTENYVNNDTHSKLLYLCYVVYISRKIHDQFISFHLKKNTRPLTIINTYGNEGAGLTDRIHGMVATHIFCNTNSFLHKIYHKIPFDLEKYFSPNQYDWQVTANDINLYKKSSLYLKLATLRDRRPIWFVLSLFSNIRGLNTLFLNMSYSIDTPEFNTTFHRLFKATSYCNEIYSKSILQRISSSNYACASLRFCRLLGDSNEKFLTILNQQEKDRLILKCIATLDKLQTTLQIPLVVTSDSPTFLMKISSLENQNLIVSTTKIHSQQHHIGFSSEIPDNEADRIFVDLLSIARARYAYQIKIGPMYNSRFPRYASLINNVPYRLIEL